MKYSLLNHIAAAAAIACTSVLSFAQVQPNTSVDVSKEITAVYSINVKPLTRNLVADGRSKVEFEVKVYDSAGKRAKSARVLIRSQGALLQTEEGAPSLDAQTVELKDGMTTFTLIAPATPGVVRLSVESGLIKATGDVRFSPDKRDMIAIGVVEGVLSFNRSQVGSITPTSFNDGFEQEIVNWSRSLGGDANASGRTAFFLKGKIAGDALLTAAYDSDKQTRLLLSQLVDPNQVYPVYGDGSIAQMEAQSKDRLFVRIDKERSFILYGDFSTLGSMPAPLAGKGTLKPADSVVLGKYTRNATGIRGHYEKDGVTSDGFLISDSLTHVTEEYPANGTSGPFAVRNGSGVQNSETVEIIVRDRNQLGLIKSTTALVRYQDYTYEPFSGRILLNSPLSSITPTGDPQSLRISYEVDQGGPTFLTYGLSGSVNVGPLANIGGSAVRDENPLAPYQLTSANTQLAITDNLRLSAEIAQSQSTRIQNGNQLYASPTGRTGDVGSLLEGNATRLDITYQQGDVMARAWTLQADDSFDNASSGVAAGKKEGGAQAGVKVKEGTDLYAQYTASSNSLTSGERRDAKLGVKQALTPTVKLDVSLRTIEDNLALPQEAQIAPNSASPAGTSTSSGGFFGTGTSNTSIDPVTGSSVSNLAPTGTAATTLLTHPVDAITARVGLEWTPSDKLAANAGIEGSINGDDYYRADAGAIYSLNEKDRLFIRGETQSGLASPSSLNAADRSNILSAGVLHSLSEETTAFSEYRFTNAYSDTNASTSDQMLVNGLQNRKMVGEGVQLSTSGEYLSVLSGSRQEAFALTGGLDFTTSKIWRASTKLEYRQIFDDQTMPGDQGRDQILSTISYARKLDMDWTLLLKNYYLYQHNRDDAAGNPIGNSRQERFITGFAWRPTEHNRFNALIRYEYKAVDDGSQMLGDRYDAHIGSANFEYKPSRNWWANTRFAIKSSSDYTVSSPDQTFNAWLWSGRATYDVTDKLDIGVLLSTLQQEGKAHQDAQGLEAGYQVRKNVWVSVGYNWMGYYDRDLSGTDYTRQGMYLRLRAKFDEKLLTH